MKNLAIGCVTAERNRGMTTGERNVTDVLMLGGDLGSRFFWAGGGTDARRVVRCGAWIGRQ